MKLTIFIRPPQQGHSSGSTSYTRLISIAQFEIEPGRDALWASFCASMADRSIGTFSDARSSEDEPDRGLARIPRCVHNQSGQARAGDEPAWGQLWTNQSTAMHRAVGDAATAVTRVDLPLLPRQRQAAIVWVALDQVFRDQHRRSTEVAVTLANERAVGVIDFVALVLRREQTGASVARA
jgi:hypothetical protein